MNPETAAAGRSAGDDRRRDAAHRGGARSARVAGAARRVEPIAALSSRREAGGRFLAALMRADRVNVIAECKRRSPSRGVLRADYDPVAIATGYAGAGAAAISVLDRADLL